MRAQYQVLSELKRVDEKVLRLQTEADRIPLEVQKLNAHLVEKRSSYDTAKRLVDECEKKLRKAEGDVKEKDDKLKKAEEKLMEVKTNEEYQAALKENEGSKKERATLEEAVTKLNAELEIQRKNLREVESTFKEQEGQITAQVTKLESERSEIVKRMEEQIGLRGGISAQLSSDVSSVYQRLSGKVRGGAVGYAENGMCKGCNMKIRPQLYNEILGFKAIHRCPTCGRILIIAPPPASETGNAQSAQ